MFGKIKLANFVGLGTMPQKAATAWGAMENSGMCGAEYKPILYCGEQEVKGTNYWFIVEQTLVYTTAERRLFKLAINYFNGKYTPVLESFEEIEFGI